MAHWDSQAQEEDVVAIARTVDSSLGHSLERVEEVEVEEGGPETHFQPAKRHGDHPISAWEEPAIAVVEVQACAGGNCSKAVDCLGSWSKIVGKDASQM